MLRHVTKAGFFNNQFIEVHNEASSLGDVATSRLLESIKKDNYLNGYNPESASTIYVPHFSFDLISYLIPNIQHRLSSAGAVSPVSSYGSCAFDLAQGLDLLPSSEHGVLVPMVEVEVDKVSRYNDRYCGYLSRHGLVLLASHCARRVSTPGGLNADIVIDTSLGRFNVFEHDHQTYVHFDSRMRTAFSPASITQQNTLCVPDMNAIRKAADGWHFVRNLYVIIDEIKTTKKDWKEPGSVPTIKIAIRNVLQDLDCSVFLPRKLAKEWQQISQFSSDMLQSVAQVFFDIQEPRRLVQLRDIFSDGLKTKDKSFGGMTTAEEEVEEAVIRWGFVVKLTSGTPERLRLITDLTSDDAHSLVMSSLGTMCKGHAKFRAATLDYEKLSQTSDKRFLSLYEMYKKHRSTDRLEEELQKLLHKPENICLVLWQGVLATMAYWNARKALQYGIESPDEWVQFVLAQDADVLIG